MKELRFRQIHLDFHTSPDITSVGERFDKKVWQERLRLAHADSVTCFSCCHHGMSYHPTKIGRMHPGLKFNLLREQMNAAHEIGVNVPIYLTGGLNNHIAGLHPEWREINRDGRYMGWAASPLDSGFMKLCFNSPYLDYLCSLIDEALELFPDADGVFLDIISQNPCCCPNCMKSMLEKGYDPENPDDVKKHAHTVLMNYFRRTTETVHRRNPNMPLYHNTGIGVGNREVIEFDDHLELESLPTGGWGYDHFPMSAAYSRNLGRSFLGMTGKFHGTWGEFGGFKHPNALRYECAAMLANGAKCSVGDQLHPSGEPDLSTCELIGKAYAEVERKEEWCRGSESAAKLAVLSRKDASPGSIGASRFFLETHIPFDFVDEDMDWSGYAAVAVAEEAPLSARTAEKLNVYLKNGGRAILTGESPIADGKNAFDLNGVPSGKSPFAPDFIQAEPDFAANVRTPFLTGMTSMRFKAAPGASVGKIFDPWFNRSYRHFCSHQHAPYHTQWSGFDAGAIGSKVLYFAHPVFELYCALGMVELKLFLEKAVRKFLEGTIPVEVKNLPSTGRIFLMRQDQKKRVILHSLYAVTALRGENNVPMPGERGPSGKVEVIEDLPVLHGTEYAVAVPSEPLSVVLQPENRPLPFSYSNGFVSFAIEAFSCHAMAVITLP